MILSCKRMRGVTQAGLMFSQATNANGGVTEKDPVLLWLF